MRIGEWRLDEVVAHDEATTWYAAEREGERACVRVLDAPNPALVERFLALAGLLRRVRHPGVPRVRHAATSEAGEVFHVLDPIAGAPIRRVRDLDAVLAALQACHAAGVLLVALVPERTLVDGDGEVQLLDAGMLDLVADDAAAFLRARASFVAPEVALVTRAELDPRADVFAAGALARALLAGRPAVSASLAAVVDRALAPAIRDRWPDVRAMRAALEASLRTS